MSNKKYGLNYERKEKRVWEDLGYTVMRSRGSFGMFDLIVCHKSDRWTLVSVKSTKKKKYYFSSEIKKIEKFDNAPKGTEKVLTVYTRGKRKVLSGGIIE